MSAAEVNQLTKITDQSLANLDSSTVRTIEEVKAAIVVAQRFPRNEELAIEKIHKACQRTTLAETSLYYYERAGTPIEGPSIRLAEQIITHWGNVQYGVLEISTDSEKKETTYEAFAWDMENNVRVSKKFTVKHARFTKKGGLAWVDDPRDVYEIVMSHGARRLRSCILAIVPEDVVDSAVEACKKTLLKNATKEPKETRIKNMIEAFKLFGVTQAMIENKYGCKAEALSELLLVKLRSIFQSLKDGFSKPENFFEMVVEQPKGASSINKMLAETTN